MVSIFLNDGSLPWLVSKLKAPHLWCEAYLSFEKNVAFYAYVIICEASLNVSLGLSAAVDWFPWILSIERSVSNLD